MKLISVLAALIVRLLTSFISAPEAEVVETSLPMAVPTVEAVLSTTAPTAEPLNFLTADLGGEWEGHWEMFSANGTWEEKNNCTWNCWAELNEEDQLYLWDAERDKNTGLACLPLERAEDGLSISGGWFLNESGGFENWRVKLSEDEDGLQLVFRGNYGSSAEGFSFVIYLRPVK